MNLGENEKWEVVNRALQSKDKDKILALSREILTREREKQFHLHPEDVTVGQSLYVRKNGGSAFYVYEAYICLLEKELDSILLKYKNRSLKSL